jgi:UDPglucose 6-dehydrogenase
MRISIIGVGYVGLVTGSCLAEQGHDVWCIDVNKEKIDKLNRLKVPFYEPGLEELVARNASAERLHFTTDMSEGLVHAEAVFIAVGTPTRIEDGSADLQYVEAAARSLGMELKGSVLVIVKSTVPVGTAELVEKIIKNLNPDLNFSVISNPEFLREGSAIADSMNPDRIVAGVSDPHARGAIEALYAPFKDKCPILFTSQRNAELIKYASNAFLALKVAFINEIADLCEAVGGDVSEIAKGIGMDKRIGPKFLKAGPGFGGSCFPKDSQALAHLGLSVGSPMSLVEESIKSNNARKLAMVQKIQAALDGDLKGKSLCILGVTFKPDTDDIREAPALVIVPRLAKLGAIISIHDPSGPQVASQISSSARFGKTPYEAAEGADALVLLTEWQEYTKLNFLRLSGVMRGRNVIDLRNHFEPTDVRRAGFKYTGIGR